MSPRALELRIHGVNNTPPPAMLALPEQAVEQFRGDKFGSFWRPLKDKVAELHDGHSGIPREDIEREAYSWGGMARSTPGAPGSGVASVAANVLGRIGWALLLPFGLANVAYWSREIPRNWTAEDEPQRAEAEDASASEPEEEDAAPIGSPAQSQSNTTEAPTAATANAAAASEEKKSRWWFNAGRGAASTRLFGLGLTILLVLSVCAVVIDLYAVQCSFADVTCRQLPEWLDVLRNPARHVRVLAASAVPVLLLVGLLLLTSLSRSRYEMAPAKEKPVFRAGVLFSRQGMWEGSPRLRRLTRLHLAAGFCVVTLVTSWELAPGSTTFSIITGLAFLFLFFVALRVAMTATDCPDAPKKEKGGVYSWLLVVATGLLLAAHAIALNVAEPEFHAPLAVTTWGPPIVTGFLLAIALSAWSWRKRRNTETTREWPVRLLVGLALVLALAFTGRQPWLWGVVVITGAALFAWAWNGNHKWQAWRGTGPGVLLGLSVTSSLLLSTVLVLTARSWLNGTEPMKKRLEAPWFYWWFAGSFTLVLALLAVLLLVVAGFLGWRVLKPKDFLLDTSMSVAEEKRALVMRWRHVIATSHRAEIIVGVLSALSTLAIALTVYVSFAEPFWLNTGFAAWLIDWSVTVTALAGVSLIGSFVGAGLLANRRPLGLLWDLMCFLPRTAHPFAPPCYAERAVPEIAGRVVEFLDKHPDEDKRTVVVLSAHSLGAVLAIAALYALPGQYLERVKLLTYGVQLRPYFGRIFPELLGPEVLGIPRCRRGTLWRLDPWAREDDPDAELPEADRTVKPDDTVKNLMAGKWINLWRRTDYLGFPVFTWARPTEDSVDQWANETNGSPDKVETHSDYHRCDAYEAALEKLVPKAQASQLI
ncbi:hypothetical protein ACIA8G_00070 [Lentzea sp. NPDC051213]|uniref:hypothetical protein n=1 Tax=Lentzea sp. NPDC051213 TaxID=3364126 RepID=UPI003794DE66